MSVKAGSTGSVMEIPAAASAALAGAKPPDGRELERILERAGDIGGLCLDDAASLLMVEEPGMLTRLYAEANSVKETVFGPRVVLFAPLYLSNHCSNDCLYCGFRRSNKDAVRRTLDVDEAVGQAGLLASRGFKRLLLVAGEHPGKNGLDYLVEVAHAIYDKTDIRILHVNCAPLDVEGFIRLKAAGYGVYQCFQETYHPDTYAVMHPSGRKREFGFRLSAMDRALDAGFGDVGIGALLGLYDYRFDVLATIAHSQHLEERFGAAAHTISVPRLRPAAGWRLDGAPSPVSDDDFRKIVAVYRLAVPYAGVVVSTREPEAIREAVLDGGASQISAGSSTEPGGYSGRHESAAQFSVTDTRGLIEMMEVIAARGLLPSLCTSCYRSGRQGAPFRELASSGAIKDFCTPNAILSLKEFILENRGSAIAGMLERVIAKYAGSVEGPLMRDLAEKLARIEKGEKDVRY
jgi:2-iminoacetate synthase